MGGDHQLALPVRVKRKLVVILTCFDAERDDWSVELIRIDRIVVDPKIRQVHSDKSAIRFRSGWHAHQNHLWAATVPIA
jgi:hypothetical protein